MFWIMKLFPWTVFAYIFMEFCIDWLSIRLETPERYLHVSSHTSLAPNRSSDSWLILVLIFLWPCAIFAWLPTRMGTAERYLHVLSQTLWGTCICGGICMLFHEALRGICMASNRFKNSWAVFARVFMWLCEVFAWLPKGPDTPERYLHVFSRGSARYLHGFQKV